MQDAAHKLIYSHPRMVADLLRGFLPDGAEAGFDFDTLEPMPASHVGQRPERREGDLMWRLRARAAPADGWVHVLVLLEFQSGVDRSMALRVLTYTGLAWEGLLRSGPGSGKRSGDRTRPRTPLPPAIPFVVYNGSPRWTAPEDVSDLVAASARALARLQPRNRYVLLDMQRSDAGGVPEDNLVGLQAALVRTTPGEDKEILARLRAALAGPEHEGLRKAFTEWLRRWRDEDYDLESGADEAFRGELDRVQAAGEVEAMGSLAAKRWKEQQRKKEAQIRARAMEQGRAEGLEIMVERLTTQRFNASTGERLSALLAGVSEPERLTAVGVAVVECGTGEELLAAARRIVGDRAE